MTTVIVVVYVAGALVAIVAVPVAFRRSLVRQFPDQDHDGVFDWCAYICVGFCFALTWPVALVLWSLGYGASRLARRSDSR